MKTRRFGFVAALITAFGVLSAPIFVKEKSEVKEVLALFSPSQTYTNGDKATYYNGISDVSTGNTLLSSLRSLNSSKRKTTMGYSSMGTSPAKSPYIYTDYDVTNSSLVKTDKNGQPYSEVISSFYTYTPTSSWNKEHVWPDSLGGNKVEADIHMPRPTISAENSSRGNSFFVEGKNKSSGGWDPYAAGYSADSRGEAARITFYCMVASNQLDLIDEDSGGSNEMGNLNSLIKWNIEHPVTEREKRRNEGAEYLQGNRNPFIDHPEYACRIWGSTNATTQALCNNASYPSDDHEIAIKLDDGTSKIEDLTNNKATTINVGDTANFFATVDGVYSNDVSWSIDKEDIAVTQVYNRGQYSNGVSVTGVKGGAAVLTLTYSYTKEGQNKSIKYSTVITVKDNSGGGSVTGDGKVTIDSNIEGLGSSTSTESTLTSDGITFKGKVKDFNGSKVWFDENSGYLYNTTNLGKITKITINYASGGSSSANQVINVGTSPIEGFKSATDDNGTIITTSTGGSKGEFVPNGDFGFFNISVKNKNLQASSIEVEYANSSEEPRLVSLSSSGETTEFNLNDTFRYDGVLTAHYDKGDDKVVTPTSVSTPNMSTIGEKTVVVTYSEGGVTKSYIYKINVKEGTSVSTLLSISLSGQKTEYFVNDTFSFTGKCVATYSDKTVEVTPTSVSTPDMSIAESKTITVSFTDNGVTVTATYVINVREKSNDEGGGDTPTPTENPPRVGCGGDVSSMSIILSILAISGIIFVIINKFIKKKEK